jgi:hypothetical protein
MKRNILIALPGLFAVLFFSACSDGSQTTTSEMTLLVGPQQTNCPSGPQGKCLQVKYSADSEWVNFGEVIQGFEWEPGYEYELRVKVTERRPKNYDFILRSFELIEVINKTPAD